MTTHITPRAPELKAVSRRWAVVEAGATLASGRLTGTYKQALAVVREAKGQQRTWCMGKMR